MKEADSPQSPQHIGYVGSENTAINMSLVYYDILEITKESGPRLMVGQDAQMEHIGVAQHYPGLSSYVCPLLLRCIAVKSGHSCRRDCFASSSQ